MRPRDFPARLSRRCGIVVRCQRGGDDRLLQLDVNDGRDGDGRRVDDVDGVDANARTVVDGSGVIVRLHVGRDDGGDDAAVPSADAVALSTRYRQRGKSRQADRAGWGRVFLGVDHVGNRHVSAGRRAGGTRDAASGAVVRGSDRDRRGGRDSRRVPVTAWKARQLDCCRDAPGPGALSPAAAAAWRHGLRLGLRCSQCCAGLMAILLVIGVMDLRAMAVVAGAITVERLAPAGERLARAIGAVIIGTGLFLIARAAGDPL